MSQEAFIHKGSNKSNKIETLNSYDLKVCNMPAILQISQIEKTMKSCAEFDLKYIEIQDFK